MPVKTLFLPAAERQGLFAFLANFLRSQPIFSIFLTFFTFLWIWGLTQGGKETTNKETFIKERQEGKTGKQLFFMFEVMKKLSLQYASGKRA